VQFYDRFGGWREGSPLSPRTARQLRLSGCTVEKQQMSCCEEERTSKIALLMDSEELGAISVGALRAAIVSGLLARFGSRGSEGGTFFSPADANLAAQYVLDPILEAVARERTRS
jgi:hypothetical protein